MTTTLRAGGIAIIGYNADMVDGTGNPATEDKIHFVITQPITTGTVIHFTDRTWTPTAGSTTLGAGTFSNSGTDGTFTWTAARDYAAGEVVTLTQAQLHGANLNFDHNGAEVVWAYQGTADAPTHFLWALEAGQDTTFNQSLVNTGLVAGYTAGAIAGDSGAYVGPSTHAQAFLANGAGVTILHAIADPANWAIDDQDGQNALEQPAQTQNWFVHHDVDLWSTSGGGGGGIINLGSDATQGAGAIGQQISNLYNNLLNNGVSVFWSLNDMVIDPINGKFFLADSDIQGGHNRILQGNIADLLGNPGTIPALTVLYSDPGITTASTIDTLAIDPVNGIVYFTHGDNLEKIVYNTPSQTPTVLFSANTVDNPAGSGSNFFGDIAINFTTNEVYLSSYRVTTATSSDAVTKNYIYKLTGLTPNAGADHFTFPNGKAALLPFSPDDDDATAGSTVLPGGEGFPKEEGTISGLAINPLTNMLYFSTGSIRFDHDASSATPAVFVRGAIFSYNLNTAQNPTGLYTQIYEPTDDGDASSQTIQPQFGPQGLLNDIEIDIVNNKWYVVDYTGDQLGQFNPPGDEGIWRGNLNGTGQPEFFGDINNINGLAPKGFTINNAPTLTGSAAGGLAVTEASSAPNSGETSRVLLFTGIAIDDVNTGPGDEITGAVIRIGEGFTYEAASTAGGHTGTVDYLRLNGLTGTTVGNETSYTVPGSGIVAKYNVTTGAMVLTGAATVAEYKAAIELVQFSTSGDNVTADGTAVTRKVYVSVSDGLTMSDEIVATVNVTGINDAPVNVAGFAMNFTEDTTGTVGSLAAPFNTAPVNAVTGISFADADADATSELFTVTLGVNVGTLTIRTDVVGGVTAGQVTGNGTATITVTGTQNAINTTLAATYGGTPAGQANGLVFTPPANFNGAATLTMVTNDQGNNGNDPDTIGDNGTSEADTDQKTLNVADVNDAPVRSGDGTEESPAILEDVPFTNLNAPTVANLFGGQFSDSTDIQFVAGTNTSGTTGDAFAGIAIVTATGNVNGQWQYWDGDSWENISTGTQAAARTISATTQIRFNPAANYNGAAPSLTVHLIEAGGPAIVNNAAVNLSPAGTATGGTTVYSTGTVVLSQSIAAVNDAPVNTVGAGITINEDAAAVAVTGISIADVDAGVNLMTVTLNVEHGTLTIRTDVAGGIAAGHVSATSGQTITINATLAQINATLAAANGLTYLADANYNGADRVRVTTSDNGASGQDPVPGTGLGTDEQDVDDKAITINAVNDAPSGAEKTISMLEDGRYAFTVADFGFTDAVDNHTLLEVVVTTLPATGTLYTLSVMPVPPMGMQTIKTAVVAGQAIPVSTITSGNFVFEPAQNANGTNYSTFTFQVRDNGGTANGGQNTDGTANTITFDVTAVNDAPTIANLGTNNVAWTEGDGPVRLDAGLDAVVGDIDSANFDGGTLSVTYVNGLPEDQYTINTGGAVSVAIDPNNSAIGTVSVSNVQIATYTFTNSGFVFTFNTDATPARVQELVRAVGYGNNAGDNPTGGARNVTWTLNDGDGNANFGNSTLVVNSTVTVNAVNDAPTGQDKTIVASEDDPFTFTWADFGFSDPKENHAPLGIVVTDLPGKGSLQLNNVPIAAGDLPTSVSKADIDAGSLKFLPAADEFGAAYASFHFRVQDAGGTANSGVDLSGESLITIDVTRDNAAPAFELSDSGPGSTLAYTENGAPAALAPSAQLTDNDSADFAGGTLTVAYQANGAATDQLTIVSVGTGVGEIDVDGSNVRYQGVNIGTFIGGANGAELVVTWSANATPAAAQALVRAISYSSVSDAPGPMPKTLTFTVSDGDGGSTSANAVVSITETNDSPDGTSKTITASEDVGRVLDASDFGYSDPDAGDGMSAVVITAVTGGGQLLYDADGIAGAGAPVAVSNFPQTYSLDEIDAGNLSYRAPASVNGAALATIAFQVVDSAAASNSTDPVGNVLTIDVTAVNDTPVLVTGGPVAATEQMAVAILPAGAVSDVDLDARNGGLGDYAGSAFSVNRNSATNAAEDRFSLVAGPNFTIDGASLKNGGQVFGTISVNGSAGAIVINFTSLETIATSALVDEVIQAVRYTNTSDKPPASVDLAVGFSDGSPGGGQGSGASGLDVNLVTVTIAGVNDAPVNALGGMIATGEDTVDLWLSGMSISDPDANPATDGMYFIFQVANGSIAIRTDVAGGIVAGDIIGEATDTITVLATLNKINATLAASNGLTYTPKPNFNGNDTLTVYANDAGASGSDPGLSGEPTNEEGVATRTIIVSAAPDDPTAVADSGSVLENATLVLDVIANDTDPDGDAQVVTIEGETVTVGQALALASGATLTLQANGTLIYNPAGAFNALISPGKAATTGAGNTSATDGFSYTVNGGSAAIAVVTVNGVDGPGDRLEAPAADASLTGSGDTDLFVLDRPYSYEVSGGAGSDGFYLGANLSAGDKLDGGEGPLDTLGLQGGYGAPGTPFLFTADHLVGMEILALLPAADTRFGASGEGLFGYNLKTIDANVADGARLVVTFNTLNAGENVRFDGSAETDGSFFTYGGRGNDVLIGGQGDDGFYFGAGRFGAGDDVSGGGGDMDTLGLQGGYAGANKVVFGAGQMDGVEILALLTAADARFNGNSQAAYSYDLTMNDGNVASLGQLVVSANGLLANEVLTFNGAAETDGRFVIFSGDGADTLIGGGGGDEISGRGGADRITGGLGADQLRGGDGADTFVYLTTDDSRTGAVDQILDFGSGDTIDLSAIDANALTADINDGFTFIGSAAFSGGAGQLRAVNKNGVWTVEGDINGDGDADLIILVTTPDPLVMLNGGSFVP